MSSILLYALFLLSPFVQAADINVSCKNLALQWQPTSFSQGNLVVMKKPATQNQTGTFQLVCNNGHIEDSVVSGVHFTQDVEVSVTFRFEQVDIDSDNNSCHLHYCLTTLSLQPECRNCNFTLPVISPEAARNNSWNPVLLKWVPKSNITGDLIISNSEVDKNCQYDIFCDGFEVVNYTFVVEEAFKFLRASMTVNQDGITVEQYQCVVELCVLREIDHQIVCDETSYYHIVIPDVINGRITQRADVFYYQWHNQDSAARLQVAGDQLNCDHVQFYWLVEHLNQGQLAVRYAPTTMMVMGEGNVTLNCNATEAAISDVVIQPYFEVTLIFPIKYYYNTFCSVDICLVANESCTRVAKCGFELHSSVHGSIIDDKYCLQLELQWMPNGVGHGSLLVTKELTMDHESNFSLTCEIFEVVNRDAPLISLSAEQNETTVEFLLRHTDNVQNDCTLQMCITRSDYFGCIHNIQCTITLPASNNTMPLLLQWIPIGNLTGTLVVSNYGKQRLDPKYQYEVSCDGFEIEQSALQESGNEIPEVFNATIELNENVSMVEQFQCLVQLCSNSSHLCTIYNMIIPEINATDGTISRRPGLFYYIWLPSSAVKLYNRNNGLCDNMKLYEMRNVLQGLLILRFTPVVMIRGMGSFKMWCNSTIITEPEIADVLIQPYVDTTLTFSADITNDTLNETCIVTFCLYEISAEECSKKVHCGFQWFPPESTTTTDVDNTTTIDNTTEPCEVNTWLWVVDNNEFGEAHFLVGKSITENAESDGTTSLSCVNLTVVSLNPQPLQVPLMDEGLVSFVIQSTGDSERFQDCTFTACSDNRCELIQKCYITIALHQGGFMWSDQSKVLDDCPQSTWEWMEGLNGGILSIKYATNKKESGTIGIQCTGVEVNGTSELRNTDVATFALIDNVTRDDLSQSPYCSVYVCVRQEPFIGCKRSLNCVVKIPSNNASRVYRSYEEPPEELLQNCEQEQMDFDFAVPLCSDNTWNVFYTNRYAEGAVSLRINLQGNDKTDEYLKVSIFCSGLDIKGSTEYRLVIPKTLKETVAEFNISLPNSTNQQQEIKTQQCTLQTQRRPVSQSEQANTTMCPSTTSCNIPVKTVYGRILPKCNATEGKKSIRQLEVKSDQARVEISVSASPNNVYTVDPYCTKNNPFGHNTSEELLTNMFPSGTEEGQFTIAISFYPECENKTIAAHFMNKRLEDCHMDIYWYCQGGEQVIESLRNLQFSDETMYCEQESVTKAVIMSVEKTFGVYSEPVAILLALLIGIASLYGLLVPAICIALCCHCCKRKHMSVQYRRTADDSDTESLLSDQQMPTINDIQSPISAPAPPPSSPLSSVSPPPPQSSVTIPSRPLRRPSRPPPPPPSQCPPRKPSGPTPPPPHQSSVPTSLSPPQISPEPPVIPSILQSRVPSPKKPPKFHAPPPPLSLVPVPPPPPPIQPPAISQDGESAEAKIADSPPDFRPRPPPVPIQHVGIPNFESLPPPVPTQPVVQHSVPPAPERENLITISSVPSPSPPIQPPAISQHSESAATKTADSLPDFKPRPPPVPIQHVVQNSASVPVPPPPPPIQTPVISHHEESAAAKVSVSPPDFRPRPPPVPTEPVVQHSVPPAPEKENLTTIPLTPPLIQSPPSETQ